ncbi:MAG: bifunctional riboflavin kinase/FAD synthetase, partial [Kiritimatiellae bacterium]|nr:bifunctional riboflavin kinase/FAD synthetase [Kiritimatiellia bacterium]
FRNHPLSVLDPARTPALLMDVDERISMLRTVGTKRPRAVHAIKFTKRFASMPPEDFVSYLRREFPDLERVHCGGNWRFGANGAGTPQTLRDFGFSVKVSRYAKYGDEAISSTRIRAALVEGDIELANAMLGRRFSVSGCSVHGKGVGCKLGASTLNFEVSIPLKLGVYVVDTPYGRGVANYGIAPTMGGRAWKTPVLEVHLLDGAGMVSGVPADLVRVEFIRFLRPERKFSSTVALGRQIAADVRAARSVL